MKREPIDQEPEPDVAEGDEDVNESVPDNVDIVTDDHLVDNAGT